MRFLAGPALEAETLYILGDFFEAWVGDDDLNDTHRRLIEALRTYADKGIPVYMMRGNRDFLLGKKFARAANVTLIEDPTCIDLYGRKTLLMHGDSLCTRDERHQKSRRKMHNKLYQKAVMLLPLRYRQQKARQLRADSQQRNQQKPEAIMDVTPDEVQRVMRHFEVDLLIHGHTHRPAIHTLLIDDCRVERVVLGSWHEHYFIGEFRSDGKFRLFDVKALL